MKNTYFKKLICGILTILMILSSACVIGIASVDEIPGYIKLADGNRQSIAPNLSGGIEVCSDTAYPDSDYSVRFKLASNLKVTMPQDMDWNKYDTLCIRYRTDKPSQVVHLLLCGPSELMSGNTYWRRSIDTSSSWTEYQLKVSAFSSIFSKSENGKSLGCLYIQAAGWGNTSYDADSYFYLDSIYLKTNNYGKELNQPISTVDGISEIEPDTNGDVNVDFTFESELCAKDYKSAVSVSKNGTAVSESAFGVTQNGKVISVRIFGPVSESYTCKITLLADKIYSENGMIMKSDVSREFDVKYVDILAGLNGTSWSSMAKYIVQNKSFLLASSSFFNKFDAFSDKDKNIICISLSDKIPFGSVAEFTSVFDNIVKNYIPNNDKPVKPNEENKIKSRISIGSDAPNISEDEKKKLYAADENTETITSDNGVKSCEFLKSLDILDDNFSYGKNQIITYSQFMNMANGLRSGYLHEDENPNDSPISIGGGIAVLCEILGYDYSAYIYGGYPNGYLHVAKEIDILDGININSIDLPLSMSVACDMIKNAADADIMTLTSVGDKNEYIVRDNVTPLTEWKKISSMEGIVSANGYTDLLCEESALEKNYVTINGFDFYVGKTNAEEYIGYDVKIYYDSSKKSDYSEILYIEQTDDTKIFECMLSDISVNGNEVTYDFGGKNDTLKVSKYATYILNGKMTSGSQELLNTYDKGSVKFIASDSSSIYTVVSITAYKPYIVSGTSAVSSLVYTDDGTEIFLDANDDAYGFSVIKGNDAATLENIRTDNLVLLAESDGKGRNYKKLLISDESFMSTVSEKGDDFIVVDGTEYKTDKNVLNKLSIGKRYRFYIDSFGFVAAIKAEQSAVYGYLFGLKNERMGEVSCRIFSENKRWVTLPFASRVKIDDGKSISEDDAYSLLMSSPNGYRGIVKYKVNLNGELIQLNRPIDMTNVSLISDDAANAAENDIFRKSFSGSSYLRSQSNSFDSKLYLDKDCAVFVIPDNAKESDIDVMRVVALPSDEEYSFDAYDVDENLVTKIISINQKPKSIGGTNSFIIVKNVGSALNSKGDDCPSITGYWHGMEISMTVKTSSNLTENDVYGLNKGDPIRIVMDENHEVTAISKYIPDANGFYNTPRQSSWWISGGSVIRNDRKNGKVIVKYTTGGDYYAISYTNESVAYMYDFGNDEYRKIDFTEIIPGDAVVARMSYFTANEMIVLRK